MNKVKHWVKTDEVVEEGFYLACYGDVESCESLEICTYNGEGIFNFGDDEGYSVGSFKPGYKFAKLEF